MIRYLKETSPIQLRCVYVCVHFPVSVCHCVGVFTCVCVRERETLPIQQKCVKTFLCIDVFVSCLCCFCVSCVCCFCVRCLCVFLCIVFMLFLCIVCVLFWCIVFMMFLCIVCVLFLCIVFVCVCVYLSTLFSFPFSLFLSHLHQLATPRHKTSFALRTCPRSPPPHTPHPPSILFKIK